MDEFVIVKEEGRAGSSSKQQTNRSRTRVTGAPSEVNSSVTSSKKPNYLELDSEFLGKLQYDAKIPVPLSDYKHLQYPLASEVFCGYRPTTLELRSILQLVTASEIGPLVDLIDPVAAYPVCVPPSPAPQDATLLVGLIPGVERHLQPTRISKDCFPHEQKEQTAASVLSVSSKQASCRDTIDAIVGQFEKTDFIHPLKPQLQPVKVRIQIGGIRKG